MLRFISKWVYLITVLQLVFSRHFAKADPGFESAFISVNSTDETALSDFRSNVTIDPLGVLKDWTPGTLCNWTHVTCDAHNHVINLNLTSCRLGGTINQSLGKLRYLRYLNLENNSFTGVIPTSLGNLTNLLELRLGQNPLRGFIPPELGSLKNIYYLSIARTNLTGSLPKELSLLPNISFLYFDNNLHLGSIPDEYGNLTTLQILHAHQDNPVSGIGLGGSLPMSFNKLQSLTELNLANNQLTGPIPDSYGNMEALHFLNLSGNQMSDTIPSSLLALPQLSILDVSSNNFSGVVPQMPNMDIRISNNPFLTMACNTCNLLPPQPSNLKHNNSGFIVGISGGAAVLVSLSSLVYCCCLRSRDTRKAVQNLGARRQHLKSSNKASLSERTRNHTRNFTLKELKLATKSFSEGNVIGQGGFGIVYKATLNTGEEVAIKRAHIDTQQGIDEFYNEVELLSKIHHKYLVNLVGFCEEQGEQMLVYEFVCNGNLLERLTGVRNPPLSWRQRVHVAICAAKGLAYLHDGCNPSIIHRDMKPSNILLDSSLVAKVADFGLSKAGPIGSATHVSTGVKGTPGYLDPYYYLSWHLGTFSDVYSFGVILLQLIVAKPAVDRTRKYSQYNIVTWARGSIEQGQLEDIMDPVLIEQGYNKSIITLMASLALRCSGDDVKHRPTMGQIYQELEFAMYTHDSVPYRLGSSGRNYIPMDARTSPDNRPPGSDSSRRSFSLQRSFRKVDFDGKSWVDIKNFADGEEFDDLSMGIVESPRQTEVDDLRMGIVESPRQTVVDDHLSECREEKLVASEAE